MQKGRQSCRPFCIQQYVFTASGEWVPDRDRLIAARSDRYQHDRTAGQLFQTMHVRLCGCRKLFKAAGCGNVLLPAGELFVNRLALFKQFQLGRQGLQRFSVTSITGADLDRIEFRQYVV